MRLAEITIDRPQKMTRMGRHQVATWIEKQARELLREDPAIFDQGYTARYRVARTKRSCASIRLHDPQLFLEATKQRIVKWLLSRAKWLRQHGENFDRRWFTQVWNMPDEAVIEPPAGPAAGHAALPPKVAPVFAPGCQ